MNLIRFRHLVPILACIGMAACGGGRPSEALGTVERDRVILKAMASEIIVDLPVAEGAEVATGTLLVKLDDRRQQAVVAGARAELTRARARLEELRNGARAEEVAAAQAEVAGARAELVQQEKAYRRNLSLLQQKLISQATLDTVLAQRDSAEAALTAAQERLLVLTNGTRPEELQQGEAMVEVAESRLALEEHNLAELDVLASRDGYLDSLPWNLGDRVPAGSTVAVLLTGRSYVRVYVPEPYRAGLSVGSERTVKVDGIDRELRGVLRWIAAEAAFSPYFALNAEDRVRLMYLAEFELPDESGLPTGIPAQVLLDRNGRD